MGINEKTKKKLKTLAEKEGSMALLRPDMLKYWNYDKNEIKPEEITLGSRIKIWWKCPICGYEWQQSVLKKKINNICPKCASKRAKKGINDLATLKPELIKEWNYEKNGYLTPDMVTVGSGIKVWWKCTNGHEYQAVIRERVKGTGCPICHQYISTSFPEQTIYYYLKEYFKNVENRAKPEFLKPMEFDIYLPNIQLAIEYDGIKWHNSDKEYEREKKKYNICKQQGITLIRIKEGKEIPWNDTYDLVLQLRPKYKYVELEEIINKIINYIEQISNIKIRTNINIERDLSKILMYLGDRKNSLSENYPNLVKEWDYQKNGDLKPNMFSINSNIKVWWKCSKCGHEWQAIINERTAPRNAGCPECAKTKHGKTFSANYLAKHDSIMITNPELVKEWDYDKNTLKPGQVTKNNNKKVWWKCSKCGYEWQSSIQNRTKMHCGCPRCYGRVPFEGVNDLKTLNPEVCKYWNYEKNGELKPEKIKPGSGKLVWWKCPECGYEFQKQVRQMVKYSFCPNCRSKNEK